MGSPIVRFETTGSDPKGHLIGLASAVSLLNRNLRIPLTKRRST